MTQEEIKEGNRIIAEFMGEPIWAPTWNDGDTHFNSYRNTKEECQALIDSSPYLLGSKAYPEMKKLYYNTDWNVLMPVVEKIESLGYWVRIEKDTCLIYRVPFESDKEGAHFCVVKETTKKLAVFKAVVQFLN